MSDAPRQTVLDAVRALPPDATAAAIARHLGASIGPIVDRLGDLERQGLVTSRALVGRRDSYGRRIRVYAPAPRPLA